jgi:hypothetical protein
MTEKTREKMLTISASLITSIIVMIIGFSLNTSRADGIMQKELIDSKLPIEQYEKDCIFVDKRLEKLEQAQQADRQQYIKSISTIETHIEWIRKELEEQKKTKR